MAAKKKTGSAKRATALDIERGRQMFEEEGLSHNKIGQALGFSSVSVSRWAKNGKWVKAGTPTVPATPYETAVETVDTFSGDIPDEIKSDGAIKASQGIAYDSGHDERTFAPVDAGIERSERELRDRLAELERLNAKLEAENEELKPTRDIHGYLEDRVKWLTDNSPEGDRYWLNRAEAKYKTDNKERAKEGLPVFDIKEHPEILEDLINELKTKAAMAAQRPIEEPPSRRVKLFILRNGMPTLEPIPLESQINNMAGSLADGIVRYTRKGFKLTSPMLCMRAGCYQKSAVDERGDWKYDVYCTEAHRQEVEGNDKGPASGLAGVTTRDVMSGVR